MSLEDLRAQVEAEEKKAAEQPETEEEATKDEEVPEEPEESEEESEDPEAEEPEESEDFELDLGGEPEPGQHKPKPEEAILHKLTKQRKKRQEAETERDDLRRELEEIKAQLRGGQQQPQATSHQAVPKAEYPSVPVLYGEYKGKTLDDDTSYQKAFQDWWAECRRIDEQNSQQGRQQEEQKRRIEEMTHRAAERVSKFASEHKYKPDYVADALMTATDEIDAATNIEGSFAYLMDCVGEGSEKAALYVGTKPEARATLKRMLSEDPSGGKAIAYMTRLATKQPKHRNAISKAPEPDQPLRGDGSSKSARKLQEEYDKASTKSDLATMRSLKRKAEELGVNLK